MSNLFDAIEKSTGKTFKFIHFERDSEPKYMGNTDKATVQVLINSDEFAARFAVPKEQSVGERMAEIKNEMKQLERWMKQIGEMKSMGTVAKNCLNGATNSLGQISELIDATLAQRPKVSHSTIRMIRKAYSIALLDTEQFKEILAALGVAERES